MRIVDLKVHSIAIADPPFRSTYHTDERTTSWLKVKNPTSSQAEGRHEFFEGRSWGRRPGELPRRLDPAVMASLPGRAASLSARPGPRSAARPTSGARTHP